MTRTVRAALSSIVAVALLSFAGEATALTSDDGARVPGNVQITGTVSVLNDSTVIRKWRAKNIVAGTTVVVRVKRCDGTWATKRVTGKTGTFTITHTFALKQGFPKMAPMEGVLVHPDYERTITSSGIRLDFGSRYGKC